GYVRQVRTAAERGGAVMVGVDPDDDFPALGGVAEDVPAEEDRPAQKGQSPRDERDEDDAARRAGGTGQGPTEIQPGTHECHDPCVAGGVAGDRERRAVRPRPGTDEDPAGNDQGAGPCPGPD